MSFFRKSSRSPSAAPVPETAAGAVPGEVIAAIMAAVAVVMDRPFRVVSVTLPALEWSMEGRRQLLVSHQLRR